MSSGIDLSIDLLYKANITLIPSPRSRPPAGADCGGYDLDHGTVGGDVVRS